MSDLRVKLELDPTSIGLIIGALKRVQETANGAGASLVQIQINETLRDIEEQLAESGINLENTYG